MTARRLLPSIVAGPLIVMGALWAVPAGAAETPPPPGTTPPPGAPSTPGDQARQGLDLLMKALEGWVRQVPMFAAPEVTPEGDIIIRRLDRSPPAPSEPTPRKLETPAPDAPTDL